MHREELARDIAEAARRSFSALLSRHGDETFYAFALYTDEDCYTVVPAANALEPYRAKMSRMGETDPRTLAYYRWTSAEWAYESFSAEPFNTICEQLSAACNAVSGDAMAFAAFKTDVHRAMIAALKALDEEGYFGERRNGAVLFITSSDHDEAGAMEENSARILNRPEMYETFRVRHEVGG